MTTGTVFNPNGEILFSSLNHQLGGGIFHSVDNGDSWTNMGFIVATTSIAINSIGDIFAGTFNSGVYRSTDDGGSWSVINQGLGNLEIRALIIHSNGNIFIGTLFGGVFRSTNNGDNWVSTNQGITNSQILTLRTNSAGDIFAGTEGGGVFRSTNNGDNWVEVNQGLFGQNGQGYYVFSLAINLSGDIFAGTGDGVFRSTDNGNNWVEINQGLTDIGVLSLAINPNGGIFAGTQDGIFRSIISANLKVYLEGPYSGGGVMTTTLNTNNLIPLNSNTAYSTLTYGYTSSTVTSIPSSDIVDWVLVELRTGTAAGTKVATRAGFLKSDGTIVDTNGTSPLQFAGLGEGNYYIVIRHRNHLAIMSASAIPLSSNSALYDFSTAQLQAYGINPMKSFTGGGFGLYAGDANGDGFVTSTDFNVFNPKFTSAASGYESSDWNLDRFVTSTDFNYFNPNFTTAKQTFVP
jgi:hypothetical protein